MKAELRSHARRAARIERIHQLADENGNAKLSATATSLLETEQQRHQRRMEALTTAGSK